MSRIMSKTLKLLVVEQEEIYRYMYELVPLRGPVDLLGVSANSDMSVVKETVSTCHPDVLLLGTKKPESNIFEGLEQIFADYPKLGIVLLFVEYRNEDIEILRKLATKGNSGVAAFLRQSLNRIEQLVGIIMAVSHGQIILDPTLASFMLAGKPECPLLKQLTTRELEILSLLSKGHTNSALAKALYIDIKTVEHHLNSIYSKLRTDTDFSDKHPRVTAARLYLQQIGG